MYHVTPSRNRASIEQEGLRLSDPFWGPDKPRHVWLFDNIEDAKARLGKFWGDLGVDNDLWEVDVEGYEVEPDPHPGYGAEGPETFVVTRAVPPERLRLVT
jgi:hypothetical protein